MEKEEIKLYSDVEDEARVAKLNSNDLPYSRFFNEFMSKNIPCIAENISTDWDTSRNWTQENKINYGYLLQEYGNLEVSVADCNIINYGSQCKKQMYFKEYIHYMKNKPQRDLLYLKDWHLKKERPHEEFYTVPKIFKSDWLNEYADDKDEDDFKFVYIGPKNSWTPLHADVYSSFSWSVNIVGKKLWTLFPPGEENLMKDSLGNLPVMYKSEEFPNIKCFVITQEKDEAIFVPSCWYHQVVNLEDTISINHNWVNGCNISFVWKSLQDSLSQVEKEIIDLKDDPEYGKQCQIILKSLSGMDYESFINFITYIGNKRLRQIDNNDTTLDINHILFDLLSILKLIDSITSDPVHYKINPNTLDSLIDLKISIDNVQNLHKLNTIL